MGDHVKITDCIALDILQAPPTLAKQYCIHDNILPIGLKNMQTVKARRFRPKSTS